MEYTPRGILSTNILRFLHWNLTRAYATSWYFICGVHKVIFDLLLSYDSNMLQDDLKLFTPVYHHLSIGMSCITLILFMRFLFMIMLSLLSSIVDLLHAFKHTHQVCFSAIPRLDGNQIFSIWWRGKPKEKESVLYATNIITLLYSARFCMSWKCAKW